MQEYGMRMKAACINAKEICGSLEAKIGVESWKDRN